MAKQLSPIDLFAQTASMGTAVPTQTPVQAPTQAPAPAITHQKAQTVEQASLAKKALVGSASEQWALATLAMQGNEGAEEINRLLAQDPLSLAAEHGPEALKQRAAFSKMYTRVRGLKNREETTGGTIRNTAIDATRAGVNTAGGAAALGANVVDQIFDTKGSELISRALQQGNEFAEGLYTPLRQQRNVQHQLEAQLHRQENQAQYEAELEANKASDSPWERAIKPWLKHQGRSAADTVANYADDPMMQLALVPEAIGSLAPATVAIKGLSKASAVTKLMKGGMTRPQALAELRTPAGQALLKRQEKIVGTGVLGTMESGAAVTQAQQEVISLSDEELAQNPIYQELRGAGATHEDAHSEMIRNAGTAAGATAAPGALVAGRIAAPFAARPLSPGAAGSAFKRTPGASAAGAARNVASETVEEALQEANSQVASNIGQRAVGEDVDITEGMGEAAAQGALGGIASAGPLQAPGAALGTAAELAGATGRGVGAGVDKLTEVRDERRDQASPVGTRAQTEATQTIEQEVPKVLENLAQEDAPAMDPKVRERMERSVYLTEQEEQDSLPVYPSLQEKKTENPDRRLTRNDLIEAAGQDMLRDDIEETDKIFAAVDVISSYNDLLSLESPDVAGVVSQLPEEEQASYRTSVESLQTRADSKIFNTAVKQIEELTPEKINSILDLSALDKEETPETTKEAIVKTLRTISIINPTALGIDKLDQAMNQLSSLKDRSPQLAKSLSLVKSLVQNFTETSQAKKQIEEEYNKLVPEAQRKHKTKDIVKEEIHVRGHSGNKLPSLEKHRRLITESAVRGRWDQSLDHLSWLKNFAQSQLNKVASIDKSLKTKQREPYQAWSPYAKFYKEKGYIIHENNPASIALGREAHVDAKATVQLYNTLREVYETETGRSLPETLTPLELAVPAPNFALNLPTNPAPTEPVATEQVTEQVPGPVTEQVELPEVEAVEPVESFDAETTEQVDPEEFSEIEDLGENVAEPQTEPATTSTPKDWFQGVQEKALRTKDTKENHFLESYTPRDDGLLRLTSFADPIEEVSTRLDDVDTPLNQPENSLRRDLAALERAAVRDVLTGLVPEVHENLTNRLAAVMKGETVKDPKNDIGKLWKAGKDVLGYENTLPLNLAVEGPDGKFMAEPRTVEAASMAAIEWLLQNISGPSNIRDDEDINKMFGRDRNAPGITPEMRKAAYAGTPIQWVLDDMARGMENLLGVRSNDEANPKFTQGILKSVAGTVMEMMAQGQKTGGVGQFFEISEATVKVDGKPQTHISVSVPDNIRKNETIETLRPLRNPFSQLFTGDSDSADYQIGEPIKSVKRTQLRNDLAEVTKDQKKVIERVQNIPNYLNQHGLQLLSTLGDETYLRLRGYVDLPSEEERARRYNKEDLARIEGKNIGLVRALQAVHEISTDVFRAEEETLNNDGEISSKGLAVYFRWAMSSVGRLQQQGAVTPQGDKIMREMLGATHSTLDLRTENGEQDRVLVRAIAQSMGVSVEKLTEEQVLEKTHELLNDPDKFGTALGMLVDWVEGGNLDRKAFAEAMEQGSRNTGEDITDKMLHALHTAARRKVALDDPTGSLASNFDTMLAIEADGKTDGPINALIHMGVGDIEAVDVARLAKGGFFFGSERMSLNEYLRTTKSKEDADDLYQMAAKLFEEYLKETQESATWHLLDRLHTDFSITETKDGTVIPEVMRNLIKNPLTVFLYGSGVKGIAGKIADAALQTFYVQLSDVAAQKADGTLKSISDHPLFQDGNLVPLLSLMTGTNENSLKDRLRKPESFAFFSHEIDALVETIKDQFAEPMTEAVDKVTGGLGRHMRFTQKVAEAHTAIFENRFNKALETKKEELGVKLLSEAQVHQVFADMMEIAPIYGDDKQVFHISRGKGQKTDQTAAKSLQTLTNPYGRFSAKVTELAPTQAGVKISPYMTIGTGDGRMIMEIYLNSDGSLSTSLPVFDGVELGLDKAVDGSRQINREVFRGWMENNTYQSILEGFSHMMDQLTEEEFNTLSRTTRLELAKGFAQVELPGTKKKNTQPLTYANLQKARTWLQHYADSSAARKEAYQALDSWTDHMAGLEAPHHNKGRIRVEDPHDHEAIAQALNEVYKEALAKIESKRARAQKTQKAEIQKESEAIHNRVKEIGTKVKGIPGVSEVYQLSGLQVSTFLTEIDGATEDQSHLFRQLLRHQDKLNAVTYYFGPAAQLNIVRDTQYSFGPSDPIDLGQSFAGSGVAFIAHHAHETVLHEMLHTQTMRVLVEHFDDPRTSPPHVHHAVRELQKLMQKTRELPIAREESDALIEEDTPEHALQILEDQLSLYENNPAAQMSEFISWSLTNQQIAEKLKARRDYSALGRIMSRAIQALKKLLGIKDRPGSNVFENVRFNTQVLLAEPKPKKDVVAEQDVRTDQALNQAYPVSDRIRKIERQYVTRIHNLITTTQDPVAKIDIEGAYIEARKLSHTAAEMARHHGYQLDPRKAAAFEAVHAFILAGIDLDPSIVRQLNQLYGTAVKELTTERVLKAMGVTGTPTSDQEQEATRRLDYLVSLGSGIRKTSSGRSDLLASFVALSQTSDVFRKILEEMPAPKTMEFKRDTLDGMIRSILSSITNLITTLSFTRKAQNQSTIQRLDVLAEQLAAVEGQRRYLASMEIMQSKVDVADAFLSDKLSKASQAANKGLGKLRTKLPQNKVGKAGKFGINIAKLLVSVGDDTLAEAAGEATTRLTNATDGWHTLRAVVRDIRGQTKSNKPLVEMINRVKQFVDAVRQDAREKIPQELEKAFKTRPSKEAWSRMHRGIAKTDLTALGRKDALKLLSRPALVNGLINDAEGEVKKLGAKDGARYIEKAQALAIRMMTGETTSNHMQRNASAIVRLLGEWGGMKSTDADFAATVRAVDRLTSLYAFRMLDRETRKTLSQLAKNEAEGLKTIVNYTESMRQAERGRSHGPVAENNAWKGYVPELAQRGASIRVIEDGKADKWIKQGYVRIGDYKGDKNEFYSKKRGYYQSSVGGKSPFRQGVAQTVTETYSGVDARTGQSLSGEHAGLFFGKTAKRLRNRVTPNNKLQPGEYLLPIFNEGGDVYAYERSLDPKMMSGLQRDTHLARMLGVWSGRILEEEAAHEFNSGLVDVLKDIYDKESLEGHKDEFVNVAQSSDPVIKDAWDTLGWRLKDELTEAFGEDFVPIRRDMVDDALGYRGAGLTDFWTGVTRWPEDVQKGVQKMVDVVFGDKAYERAYQAQQGITDAVSYLKTNIIVRSVVVPVGNMISNILHLVMAGVPMPDIARNLRKYFIEISTYTRNLDELKSLEVKKAASIDNPLEVRKITARMQALEDANSKLGIAPLLEGEFSTISEDLTETDVAIREGRISEYLERLTDKLPGTAQTVAKNFILSKDTELYKALNRSVQYGDFLGKAILYEHLTKKKGVGKEAALDRIREEFVQYNRLPGRTRDTLESHGLLWFYNYKLRIMKVMARMLRERPGSALFYTGMVGPGMGIDSVWSGSLFGAGLDGRLPYSWGTQMGWDALFLNPWVNLTT